jgi:hypothetical protein
VSFANPHRLLTVPDPSSGGFVAHQMTLKLCGRGELLRHFRIARVKGQNALPIDLNRE